MVYQSGKVFTNKIHKIQIVINIKYTTQVHQKKKDVEGKQMCYRLIRQQSITIISK